MGHGREGVREGTELTEVYLQRGILQETPLNIDFEINNKREVCKIGAVCVEALVGRRKGEWRR
jgi:hypothetical protein